MDIKRRKKGNVYIYIYIFIYLFIYLYLYIKYMHMYITPIKNQLIGRSSDVSSFRRGESIIQQTGEVMREFLWRR